MRKNDLIKQLEDGLGSLDIVSRRLTAITIAKRTDELVQKEKQSAIETTMRTAIKTVEDSSLLFENDDSFGAGCNYATNIQAKELKKALMKLVR